MTSSSITNSITIFSRTESSSSKDFPAFEADYLKKNKPSSSSTSLLGIPTVCCGIIASFADSIALMQTCRQLKKSEISIWQQFIPDFEKNLKPSELNKLKDDAGFTHGKDSEKVKLWKISNHVSGQMEKLRGGLGFLRDGGLFPIISVSRYRETQKWITDENFLKFCTRLPGGAVTLRTFNQLSHAEKAKSMRMWINESSSIFENMRDMLDLSKLGLTELPPEICKFRNLKLLNLSFNRLETLPPEIGHIGDNLLSLFLNNNNLETLPPEIGKLTLLITLNLSDNNLISIPREIGQINNLLKLSLEGNLLTTLPPELSKLLPRLVSFSLQGNPLENPSLEVDIPVD